MSSSRVLIVPIIAAVVFTTVFVSLFAWVALGYVRRNRAQRLRASTEVQELAEYARDTDDVVCRIIEEMEKAPATTATLLPDDVQQAIYGAHSQFGELRLMKGIK